MWYSILDTILFCVCFSEIKAPVLGFVYKSCLFCESGRNCSVYSILDWIASGFEYNTKKISVFFLTHVLFCFSHFASQYFKLHFSFLFYCEPKIFFTDPEYSWYRLSRCVQISGDKSFCFVWSPLLHFFSLNHVFFPLAYILLHLFSNSTYVIILFYSHYIR